MNKQNIDKLEENMIFVGTIYDSFEALEETLGKLKLERPLFITHIAKMTFAEEVFKRADCVEKYYKKPPINMKKTNIENKIFN
ncbi:MAG: hypothetical protein IKW39_03365 [Alphaproteobacteria bacterium]|nr:hypothetical protein [Alphaproteobacteria bacterium]